MKLTMKNNTFTFGMATLGLTLSAGLLAAAQPPLSSYSVMYDFTGGVDGGSPNASGVVRDSAGNLFGTTYYGGAAGYGEVFELSASGTLTALHSFDKTDGDAPYGGVTLDSAGNLYGTAMAGGKYGYGTVFRLSPAGKLTVLHNFSSGGDGGTPLAPPIGDAAGNLYGTAYFGANPGCQGAGCGVVYKITKAGKFKVLYAFSGPDGGEPDSTLVRDSSGNLYGTTLVGGSAVCNNGCGTVFKLDSTNTLTTLHAFDSTDGAYPYASPLLGSDGNIYGTTWGGGLSGCSAGCGTAWQMSSAGVFSVLHSFTGGSDGGESVAGLVADTEGNLYGTTLAGGNTADCSSAGCGVVFKLNGAGTLSVLHTFTGGADGGQPMAGLVRAGTELYGTANIGGSGTKGAVFKVKE